MLEELQDHRTIEERENVTVGCVPTQGGFLPHRTKSRAVKKPENAMLKVSRIT